MPRQDLLEEAIGLCEQECRRLGFRPGEWVKFLHDPIFSSCPTCEFPFLTCTDCKLFWGM